MKRQKAEKRIEQIISYLGNPHLEKTVRTNMVLFSDDEIQEILNFLESGNYSLLYNFTEKKIDEYKELLNKVKILQVSINIEKNSINEKKEVKNESIELEKLLRF